MDVNNINRIDTYQQLQLSENFIREFKNKVDWIHISTYQKLSENFIREFKNKVKWIYISINQKLSEDFIREFKNKVNWEYISAYQKLSEDFIREFQNKVNWEYISAYQQLSEDFIKEFKDKINWFNIGIYQKLSDDFLREFHDRFSLKTYLEVNKELSKEEKVKMMKEYAEKYNLIFDGNYLYAYREHDQLGSGIFNKAIFYKKGEYYQDWHCDMRQNIPNSFGLGIFSKGNTQVKVSIDDFGIWVNDSDSCRVKGLTIL